jgi:glycosyltransferase involved in cell wall biosynthesis
VATLNTYSLIISEAYQNIQPLFASGLKESKVNYLRLTSFSSPVLEKTIQTDNFVVLYTGSFVKVQNLNLLYETAKLLANEKIEFRLIGGEEFQIEEEKSRTECLKNVKFYKRLPQKEFEEFMRSGDIVVSPRTFGEDSPQKIVDYLNYGKCILASNAKLHFEFLDPQNSYLVNPSPEDFARAILTLRDDEPLRKLLAARGKFLFEKELSYDVMKAKLSKLLKDNHLL